MEIRPRARLVLLTAREEMYLQILKDTDIDKGCNGICVLYHLSHLSAISQGIHYELSKTLCKIYEQTLNISFFICPKVSSSWYWLHVPKRINPELGRKSAFFPEKLFLFAPRRSDLNPPLFSHLPWNERWGRLLGFVHWLYKKKTASGGWLSLILLPLCFTDGRSEDHSAINDTHLSTPHLQTPALPTTPPNTHTHRYSRPHSSSSLPAPQIAFDDWWESNHTCCIIAERTGLLLSVWQTLYRLDVVASRTAWPLNCRQYNPATGGLPPPPAASLSPHCPVHLTPPSPIKARALHIVWTQISIPQWNAPVSVQNLCSSKCFYLFLTQLVTNVKTDCRATELAKNLLHITSKKNTCQPHTNSPVIVWEKSVNLSEIATKSVLKLS